MVTGLIQGIGYVGYMQLASSITTQNLRYELVVVTVMNIRRRNFLSGKEISGALR